MDDNYLDIDNLCAILVTLKWVKLDPGLYIYTKCAPEQRLALHITRDGTIKYLKNKIKMPLNSNCRKLLLDIITDMNVNESNESNELKST